MTSSLNSAPTTASPALVRFVTEGLLATIDAHRTGTLPLHRFAWELRTRIDTLTELTPTGTTLTRLRWLQRTVEHLHAALTIAGRTELTGDEQNSLSVTLVSLRTALATLTPHNPLDPSGAARPAALAAVTPVGQHRAVARTLVA